MQSRKKSVLFLLLAVVVSALAVVPAHAQSGRVSFDIPFDFVVGKTAMKAGTYRIEGHGSFVAVISGAEKARFAILMAPSDAASHGGHPYLQFVRYGNESFLHTIVFSDDERFDLPLTSREKEIIAQLTTGEPVDVLNGAAQ